MNQHRTVAPRHIGFYVPRPRHLTALGLALSLSLLSACGQGEQVVIGTPVTSLSDSGAGSLRELLAAAAPGDTLRFTAGGTLTLSTPLTLSKNVTLIADGVTVDTAGKPLLIARDAAVSISGGSWTSSAPLTTTGLAAQATTITSGGVIQNAGTLTLQNLSISGGTANLGGGVRNDGTLTLNAGARITGNKAVGSSDTTADSGEGGGIYNTGTLTLAGGSVDGNTALNEGGGIRSTRDAKLFIQSGSGGRQQLHPARDQRRRLRGRRHLQHRRREPVGRQRQQQHRHLLRRRAGRAGCGAQRQYTGLPHPEHHRRHAGGQQGQRCGPGRGRSGVEQRQIHAGGRHPEGQQRLLRRRHPELGNSERHGRQHRGQQRRATAAASVPTVRPAMPTSPAPPSVSAAPPASRATPPARRAAACM